MWRMGRPTERHLQRGGSQVGHADRDAVIAAVHVSPGGQIDAKDLLVELE